LDKKFDDLVDDEEEGEKKPKYKNTKRVSLDEFRCNTIKFCRTIV